MIESAMQREKKNSDENNSKIYADMEFCIWIHDPLYMFMSVYIYD